MDTNLRVETRPAMDEAAIRSVPGVGTPGLITTSRMPCRVLCAMLEDLIKLRVLVELDLACTRILIE